ncbi:Protein stu1, partial [Frankliniella fusca]
QHEVNCLENVNNIVAGNNMELQQHEDNCLENDNNIVAGNNIEKPTEDTSVLALQQVNASYEFDGIYERANAEVIGQKVNASYEFDGIDESANAEVIGQHVFDGIDEIVKCRSYWRPTEDTNDLASQQVNASYDFDGIDESTNAEVIGDNAAEEKEVEDFFSEFSSVFVVGNTSGDSFTNNSGEYCLKENEFSSLALIDISENSCTLVLENRPDVDFLSTDSNRSCEEVAVTSQESNKTHKFKCLAKFCDHVSDQFHSFPPNIIDGQVNFENITR